MSGRPGQECRPLGHPVRETDFPQINRQFLTGSALGMTIMPMMNSGFDRKHFRRLRNSSGDKRSHVFIGDLLGERVDDDSLMVRNLEIRACFLAVGGECHKPVPQDVALVFAEMRGTPAGCVGIMASSVGSSC